MPGLPLPVYWELRAPGATPTGTVRFRVTEAELAGRDLSTLTLSTAPTVDGPWTSLCLTTSGDFLIQAATPLIPGILHLGRSLRLRCLVHSLTAGRVLAGSHDTTAPECKMQHAFLLSHPPRR